ncbi:protein dbf4 [Anaeramoeba flamelloides]|uniref:Protein dbf4 n=1 Tax=Anaeramoeba flamelloides TaxID=1746091 RepID=A0ABQ8X5Y2_9EUKA|nr:protein dbf4 [Anaeramoeba flamelloides]
MSNNPKKSQKSERFNKEPTTKKSSKTQKGNLIPTNKDHNGSFEKKSSKLGEGTRANIIISSKKKTNDRSNKHHHNQRSKKYYKKLRKIREHCKYPFILIEDTSLLFKSSSKIFKKIRIPSSRSFFKKRSRPLNPNYSLKMLNEKKKQKKPKKRKAVKGSGNCRICGKKYTDLDKHIQTKLHRNFAQDNENYYEIDLLFKKIGNKNVKNNLSEDSGSYSSSRSSAYSNSSSSSRSSTESSSTGYGTKSGTESD